MNKENENSRGISGVTIKDFSEKIEPNLKKLSLALHSGTFKFEPTRAAIIKKGGGKYRPLQIPEVRDRIVLKALSVILEVELKELLEGSENISFAYQKGKGVREATLEMKSIFLDKGGFFLKADIVNFFDEIKKEKLLEEYIFPKLKDQSINKIISEALGQKLKGLNRIHKERRPLFKNAGIGIPQGNPLSPLMSNIYLSRFDSFIRDGGYSMIRYADDFIVLFDSYKSAVDGHKLISEFLVKEFSLKIHPLNSDKTKIVNPIDEELSFLGIRFDGKKIYPGKETLGILKSRIKRILKNGSLDKVLFKEIYEVIEKWIAIYSYLDIERYFPEIDSFLLVQLKKRFGKRKFYTTNCNVLAQKRRSKQYDKGKRSFWRTPKLQELLPDFVRRKTF